MYNLFSSQLWSFFFLASSNSSLEEEIIIFSLSPELCSYLVCSTSHVYHSLKVQAPKRFTLFHNHIHQMFILFFCFVCPTYDIQFSLFWICVIGKFAFNNLSCFKKLKIDRLIDTLIEWERERIFLVFWKLMVIIWISYFFHDSKF